ncbi:MAG: hypothetical protein AAF390_10710 [Pseudomonadota bacterium]
MAWDFLLVTLGGAWRLTILAGLRAAPFALRYVHWARRRGVPEAMLSYKGQAQKADGEVQARSKALLRHLPHFEAEGPGSFLDRLSHWVARHEVMVGPDGPVQRAVRSAE